MLVGSAGCTGGVLSLRYAPGCFEVFAFCAYGHDAAEADPDRRCPEASRLPDARQRAPSAVPRLLEADDVARYLGMRTDWVYREVRAGRLPHIRLGRAVRFLGRAVRFRRESIEGKSSGRRASCADDSTTVMRSTAPKDHQLSLLGTADASTAGTVDPGCDMQDETTHKPAKQAKKRRPRGTGAVLQKGDRWYGQWYIRGRLVKRSLGPVRQPGTRDGLTKPWPRPASRADRRRRGPAARGRTADGRPGRAPSDQAARVKKGRKSSTTENYESYLRVHLEPYFGDTPIAQITAEDVEDFVATCLDRRLSTKSTLNYVGFLHGIFDFAIRKRLGVCQPV